MILGFNLELSSRWVLKFNSETIFLRVTSSKYIQRRFVETRKIFSLGYILFFEQWQFMYRKVFALLNKKKLYLNEIFYFIKTAFW